MNSIQLFNTMFIYLRMCSLFDYGAPATYATSYMGEDIKSFHLVSTIHFIFNQQHLMASCESFMADLVK